MCQLNHPDQNAFNSQRQFEYNVPFNVPENVSLKVVWPSRLHKAQPNQCIIRADRSRVY